MAYVPHTPNLGFPPIAATLPASNAAGRSTPGPWLGDVIRAQDPVYGVGEFIYLAGVAATGVGSWVVYNPDDWSTVLLGPDMIGSVAVAMSANINGQFGWYQIKGKAIGKALAGFLDNANVYATATPGSVDDAVVAGDRVKNAKGASAVGVPSAGLAEFEIDRPFADDGLAA
ncbi:MAG: hypothetical protein E5Y04_28710 [Mesorhizobium sp.]|uniref:hypothetical protein n=1 Tax=Mesorhizobium TaxID=68287 RepID=UPI0004AEC6D5|nr:MULTISPECIES: hypothetical protein [Mesorhizobium]RWN47365.1 MAG: hypothetical protein EOS03_13540 [Mesorhizobium sp.]TJV21089.1 MAG: hypothetical protein E5Y04_28710 [Mesorhizobium sp.]